MIEGGEILKKSNHKKLVTADDYRMDRDSWRRRALKQQRVIDTINRHNDRLGNAERSLRHALNDVRSHLQSVCPHDEKYAGTQTNIMGQELIYCDFCFQFVPNKKRPLPTDA